MCMEIEVMRDTRHGCSVGELYDKRVIDILDTAVGRESGHGFYAITFLQLGLLVEADKIERIAQNFVSIPDSILVRGDRIVFRGCIKRGEMLEALMGDGEHGILQRADDCDVCIARPEAISLFDAVDDARHDGKCGLHLEILFEVDLIGKDDRAQEEDRECSCNGAPADLLDWIKLEC